VIDPKTLLKKYALYAAGLLFAISLTGAIAKKLYDQKLQKAEDAVVAVSQAADRQIKAAHDSILVAQAHEKKADALLKKVADNFNTVASTAPDTCWAVVVAADSAIAAATDAYTEEKRAAGALRGALQATSDTLAALRGASQNLVNVVKKPSLLARLKPDLTVGLGPQVGIDAHGKAYAGVGVTAGLSWRFHT
jgi:hypothetical protein